VKLGQSLGCCGTLHSHCDTKAHGLLASIFLVSRTTVILCNQKSQRFNSKSCFRVMERDFLNRNHGRTHASICRTPCKTALILKWTLPIPPCETVPHWRVWGVSAITVELKNCLRHFWVCSRPRWRQCREQCCISKFVLNLITFVFKGHPFTQACTGNCQNTNRSGVSKLQGPHSLHRKPDWLLNCSEAGVALLGGGHPVPWHFQLETWLSAVAF
jgi:hypothetical protein